MTNLSRRQGQILEEISDYQELLVKWHDKPQPELKNDDNFKLAFAEYKDLIMKAVRAGLKEHELVKPHYQWLRHIGNRKYLRDKGKRVRAEKGVKRLPPVEEIILSVRIVNLAEEGKSRREVREILSREGAIKKDMSRQGFDKLLKKLEISYAFDD